MQKEGNEETTSCVSKQNEHFLTKTPKTSLKVFAIFCAGILILTSLFLVRAEPITVDANNLPWSHVFSPGETYTSIDLVNIKNDMVLSLEFENVAEESDLNIGGKVIGTIQPNIKNLFLYRTYNATQLSITFTITSGLRIEIDRVMSYDITAEDSIHICGKTYFTLSNKHIIDITIPLEQSHKADLSSSGNLTYMAFTEFPAFEDGISRYGVINNTLKMISLPRGTKILRLISDELTDFDTVISPYEFIGIGIIDVIGTSGDAGSKHVRTITAVQQIYDIRLICLDLGDTIAEGSSTGYLISVENLGNGPDTVDLYIEKISGSEWDAILSDTVVELGAGESTDVILNVTAPPNSDGETAIIKVNGISRGNLSVNSSITTTTLSKKPGGYDHRIEPGLPYLRYPTERGIFAIRVYNFGNVQDTVSLSLWDVPWGWSIYLDPVTVTIDTNESEEVNITVIPPPDAVAGEHPITIIGVSLGNSSISNSTDQIISIKPIYDVELTPGSQVKIDAPKGAPVTFPIDVENPGNAEEDVNVSVDEDEGEITDIYGYPVTSLTLLPWEIKTVYLHMFTATTPETSTSAEVTVESEDDPNATDNSTSSITTEPFEGGLMSDKFVKILGMPLTAVPIPVRSREEIDIPFTVKNEGDEEENISFNTTIEYNTTDEGFYDLPSFSPRGMAQSNSWNNIAQNTPWTFTLDDDNNSSTPFNNEITLEGGESQEMHLHGTVPYDVPENEWAKVSVKASVVGYSNAFDRISGLWWATEINPPVGPVDPGEGGGNPPGPMSSMVAFNITCEEPIKTIRPGNIVSYTITITNFGDTTNTINLTLFGIPSDWDAFLDDDSITLTPQESRNITLYVHPSIDALAASDADIDDLVDVEEVSYTTNKLDLDSDNDRFWDGAEKVYWELLHVCIENISLYLNNPDVDNDTLVDGDEAKYFTDPINPDTDGDGFSDGYEIDVGTDPLIADSDADGLEDDYEIMIGTNPLDADTDHDGLTDYQEVNYDYDPQTPGIQSTDPLNYDTDFDGLWDGFYDRNRNNVFDIGKEFGEDVNLDGIINIDEWNGGTGYGETNPLAWDSDGDMLPDGWEAKNSLNPLDSSDSYADSDGDGLTNLEEYQNATNPTNTDTDHDGLEDLWELNNDFDPRDIDMDEDGMPDGWEWYNSLDPKDPTDAEYDFDNDGLNNLEEYCWASDMNLRDSDNDGFEDGWEVEHGLNPSKTDSDDDGMPDVWEVQNDPDNYDLHPYLDKDGDQLTNLEEYQYGTNVSNPDSDGDGFPDGWEVKYGMSPTQTTDGNLDLDWDGLTTYQEFENDTNPINNDTDFDLMPDLWEIENGTDPRVKDYSDDPDDDGLSNLDEYFNNTNPHDSDTDNDGMLDGWEVKYNYSPIVWNDPSDDPDQDGLINRFESEYNGNPYSNDTDGDALPDCWEAIFGLDVDRFDAFEDSDNDGTDLNGDGEITGSEEFTNIEEFNSGTNPTDPDTDKDGMPDGWEVEFGTKPTFIDTYEDPDEDLLSNLGECNQGTNPHNEDSDSDLLKDGFEVYMGFDPNDPDSGRPSTGYSEAGNGFPDGAEFEGYNATILAYNETGKPQPPIADAGPDQIVNTTTVTFNGSGYVVNDSLSHIDDYEWDFGDGYTANGKDVVHNYADTGFYLVTLKVYDNITGWATDLIRVLITLYNNAPRNSIPVADAGVNNIIVQEGTEIHFNGSASYDSDNDSLAYFWSFSTFTGGVPRDAAGPKVSHTYINPGNYLVTLYVTDGIAFNTDTINVLVEAPNQPPVADAGSDRVGNINQSIYFNGAWSHDVDFESEPLWINLNYSWDFDASDGIQEEAYDPLVNHTYHEPGVYTVTLTVTDDENARDTDTCIAIIGDIPPVAIAGPDRIGRLNETIFLIGSASFDVDGQIVNYSWDFDDGTNASGADVQHIYEMSGIYNVTLTVTDDLGAKDTDSVIVIVGNQPPISNPGLDKISNVNETVYFEGLLSIDIDGEIVYYEWDFDDEGATAVGPIATHTFIEEGVYYVNLTVIDDDGAIDVDTVIVVVGNKAPVANAGPDRIKNVYEYVYFDGSSSFDIDGSIVYYRWDMGDGFVFYWKSFSHVYTKEGFYYVNLTVMDDDGAYDNDTILIVIGNKAPIANAGPDRIKNVNKPMYFDGILSYDIDGYVVNYTWELGDGSPVKYGRNITHTYASEGVYYVDLTVRDDDGYIDTDTSIVIIGNKAPIADAGTDRYVHRNTNIIFNASLSRDIDGTIVLYEWDLGDGNSSTGLEATHSYPNDGVYYVTLRVTDDDGSFDEDLIILVVGNRAPNAYAGIDRYAHRSASITFNGSLSFDIDGSIVTYKWDMGDGQIKYGEEISHSYNNDDVYYVNLTVTDNDGVSDTDTAIVIVGNRAPNAIAGTDIYAHRASTITFNGSFSFDMDGTISTWEWDMGDDTTVLYGEVVTHSYPNDGVYHVNLTVTDNDGATDIDMVIVVVDNQAPDAYAGIDKYVHRGYSAHFNGTLSFDIDGTITSWEWKMGDGTATKYGEEVYHSYANDGVYYVNLTVTDNDSATDKDTMIVIVGNQIPHAYAGLDNYSHIGTSIHFDGSLSFDVDGSITNREWDLGDGITVLYGEEVDHTYNTEGIYYVNLTVTDNDGSTDTDSTIVVVGNRVPIAIAASDRYAHPDTWVNFNGSLSFDLDGNIVDWEWDFDDGSSSTHGVNISHMFPGEGVYNVTLTVTDNNGANDSDVCIAIIDYDFPYLPGEEYMPDRFLQVNMEAEFSGDGLHEIDQEYNYTWEFGDGGIRYGVKVTYSFSNEGGFNVTLNVTFENGSVYVHYYKVAVYNKEPKAVAGVDKIGKIDERVVFDGLNSFDIDGFIVSYLWDFGDGTTSTYPFAVHRYSNDGLYNVTLTVEDDQGTNDTDRCVVIVYNRVPVAVAGSDKVAHLNDPIIFSGGASYDIDGHIVNYTWNLGDGYTLYGPLVTHIYSQEGLYNVVLTVEDENGFIDKDIALVAVYNRNPVAFAGLDKASHPNDLILFDGAASFDWDGRVTNYTWDFGDGQVGYGRFIFHNYTNYGLYNVILTVTDNDGFTDNDICVVAIYNREPVAVAGPDRIAHPNDPILFVASVSFDLDGFITNYTWDFDDGNIEYGAVISHSFTASGLYNVVLTVRDEDGFIDRDITRVAVYNRNPVAIAGPDRISHPYEEVYFVGTLSYDLDGYITNYTWDFGDDNIGYGEIVVHTYIDSGLYNVTLTVRDEDNFIDKDICAIIVYNREPIAIAGPDRISHPNEVLIFDGIASFDIDGYIVNYTWNMDDGTIKYGESITHTYPFDGVFNVVLTVKDEDGTEDRDIVIVAVYNRNPFAYAGLDQYSHIDETVHFDGSASFDLDGTIVSYHWDFGDGNTLTGNPVNHIYTEVGVYNVKLTVTDEDGAKDIDTCIIAIGNRAPISIIVGEHFTNVDITVEFNGTLSFDIDGDTISYYWEFGDGSTASGNPIVAHSYSWTGTYYINLTVTDEYGISDNAQWIIIVVNAKPEANAGFNQIVDIGDTVEFNGSLSYDLDSDPLTYFWDFGDGSNDTGVSPTHTYPNEGVYNVTLTVTDDKGASDSNIMLVAVRNMIPLAVGYATNPVIDIADTMNFVGSYSIDFDNDALSYYWDFGDGNDSTSPNTTHTYGQKGVFTVTLTVTDSDGGTDIDQFVVVVRNIIPNAWAGIQRIEDVNTTFTFNGSVCDLDGDTVYYTWDFGDGTTYSSQTSLEFFNATVVVDHIYYAKGSYIVKLTAIDEDGAATEDSVLVIIKDAGPFANAGPDQNKNTTDLIVFDGSGSYDEYGVIVYYQWNFGDISPPGFGETAFHRYTHNGVKNYTATLTIMDNQGNTATDTTNLTISNGKPVAHAGFDKIVEVGDFVRFDGHLSEDDGTIISYSWDFDDGRFAISPQPYWYHRYTTPGTYVVELTVADNELPPETDTDYIYVIVLIDDEDQDGDGIPDAWEDNITMGDPLNLTKAVVDSLRDPDDDNLTNLEEFLHLTRMLIWDTDDDSLPDGWEVHNDLDPNDNGENPPRPLDKNRIPEVINGHDGDPDSDGMINFFEYNHLYTYNETVGVNPKFFFAHNSDDDNDTDPWNSDTDGDSMPDYYEVLNCLDPTDPTGREGGDGDADFDYLPNFWEYWHELHPSHSIDLIGFGGGPYQNDFFPNAHDWDMDGMFDGYEVIMALKPKDNGTLYPELGPDGNPDGDGFDLDFNGIIEGEENLTNLEEFLIFHDNGTNQWYVGPPLGESKYVNDIRMNTNNTDSDGDGLPDGWEAYFHKPFTIDPTSADSDDDGDLDWEEDSDWDGYSIGSGDLLTNWQEYKIDLESSGQFSHLYHMNPTSNDSDADGMWDGWELHWEFDPTDASDADLDLDQDGCNGDPFTNFEEFLNKSNPKVLSSQGITLAMARDTDGDKIIDGVEAQIHRTSPSNKDTDSDKLTDYWEIKGKKIFIPYSYRFRGGAKWGSIFVKPDPLNPDTDNDTFTDGEEVLGYEVKIFRKIKNSDESENWTVHILSNPIEDERPYVDTDLDNIDDLTEMENVPIDPQQYNPYIKENIPVNITFFKIQKNGGVGIKQATVKLKVWDAAPIKYIKYTLYATVAEANWWEVAKETINSPQKDKEYKKTFNYANINDDFSAIKWKLKIEVKDINGNSYSKEEKLTTGIWDYIKTFFEAAWDLVQQMINFFKTWVLDRIKDGLGPIIEGIANAKDENGLLQNSELKPLIDGIIDSSITANALVGGLITLVVSALLLTSELAVYALAFDAVMFFSLLFMAFGVINMDDFNDALQEVFFRESNSGYRALSESGNNNNTGICMALALIGMALAGLELFNIGLKALLASPEPMSKTAAILLITLIILPSLILCGWVIYELLRRVNAP